MTDSESDIAAGRVDSEAGTGAENGTGAADVESVQSTERISQEQTAGEENVEEESAFVFGDSVTMDYNVNGRELPIYCVDTEEKKIALSFDAAWGNEDTAELLAILKEHDLKVTFFMTGGWVESYPEDVKAILAAGHDLGNHSENHKNMSELSDEEKKEEIMSVHQKVQEITGYEMFLFRPPYGDYDNALIDVLKDCEYYPIQWDVDSLDWKNEGVDAILETVTEHKNLGNGSIILCHNGAEYTAEALDTLINELEAQGYEIVPISELIYKDHYHMNVQGRQISDAAE
ncbi:MAG: polysaccharide deacetylase family protein [Lachnospiraceae bacterium]|nr:polysaccharide deacetylase family protein [Lachnospiraceae bacterium]